MKISIKYTTNFVNGKRIAGMVEDGFKRHGTQLVEPCDADVILCWGYKDPKMVNSSKPVIVLERGYVGDRMYWTSVGLNGINRKGNFIHRDMPSDRWDMYFDRLHLEPWKNNEDGYILITGQNHKDANTVGIDLKREYYNLYNECSGRRKTLFRPHPGRMGELVVPNNVPTTRGVYEEELRNAYCVVSFSSNSLVDAMMMGIPVVSLDDRAMVWDITGHSLDDLRRPNRQQFINNLMYRQWTPDEISNGDMWGWVKEEIKWDLI